MAAKNRTEIKTQIATLISPTVTVSKHTQLLRDDFAESLDFRRDVVSVPAYPTGSTITLDFANIDHHQINLSSSAAGDFTITFSNLEDGDEKTFSINAKASGKNILFSNASYLATRQDYIIDGVDIQFKVIQKNGANYVDSISVPTDISDLASDFAIYGQSDWLDATFLGGGWSGVIKSRIDYMGYIEVKGYITASVAAGTSIALLSTGARPFQTMSTSIVLDPDTSPNSHIIFINSSGNVYIEDTNQMGEGWFYIRTPKQF